MRRQNEQGDVLSVHKAPVTRSGAELLAVLWPAIALALAVLLHIVLPGAVAHALSALLAASATAVLGLQMARWSRSVRVRTNGLELRRGLKRRWVPWRAIRDVAEGEAGLIIHTDDGDETLWRDLPHWELLVSGVRRAVETGAAAAPQGSEPGQADPREVLAGRVWWYTHPFADRYEVWLLAGWAVGIGIMVPLGPQLDAVEAVLFAGGFAAGFVALHHYCTQVFRESLAVSANGICGLPFGLTLSRRRTISWSEVVALYDHPSGWRLETARGDYRIHRRGRNAYAAADAIRKVLALRDQGLALPRMDMTPAGAISRVDVSAERGLMRAEEEDGETKG